MGSALWNSGVTFQFSCDLTYWQYLIQLIAFSFGNTSPSGVCYDTWAVCIASLSILFSMVCPVKLLSSHTNSLWGQVAFKYYVCWYLPDLHVQKSWFISATIYTPTPWGCSKDVSKLKCPKLISAPPTTQVWITGNFPFQSIVSVFPLAQVKNFTSNFHKVGILFFT